MNRILTSIIAACLIIHISSCQETPQSTAKEFNNIRYLNDSNVKNDSLQRLNLVLPAEVSDSPLLIWVGGGAWSYVDHHMEMDLGRKIAAQGIAFATVGHRLSSATWKDPTLTSGIKHPEHMKDLASAFQWLYENASVYGYDKENIFVGGFSSGAHLIALLSMDSTYLNNVGLSPSNIKGVIPISGAYDIQNYFEVFLTSETNSSMAETHVKAVFGETKEDFLQASPTEYISNFTLPMLLMADGDIDGYTKLFEEKLLSSDFRNFQAVYVHDMGHSDLWKNLSYTENSVYRNLITGFIKTNQSSTKK